MTRTHFNDELCFTICSPHVSGKCFRMSTSSRIRKSPLPTDIEHSAPLQLLIPSPPGQKPTSLQLHLSLAVAKSPSRSLIVSSLVLTGSITFRNSSVQRQVLTTQLSAVLRALEKHLFIHLAIPLYLFDNVAFTKTMLLLLLIL